MAKTWPLLASMAKVAVVAIMVFSAAILTLQPSLEKPPAETEQAQRPNHVAAGPGTFGSQRAKHTIDLALTGARLSSPLVYR